MICRNIRSSRRSVIMHSRSMTDKCGLGGKTPLNSKKRRESTSLLSKIGREAEKNGASSETLPRLPLVEKRDYIQNWILSSDASFSWRVSPDSPGVEAKGDKRPASSPARRYAGKRVRGEKFGTQENSGSRLGGATNSKCGKKPRDDREPVNGVSNRPFLESKSPCSEIRNRVDESSEEVKPEVSGKREDRVVCRFAWHARKSTERLAGPSRSPVTSNTGNGPKDDFIQETGSSGSFGKRSRKPEPPSPLRWTGYEIGDSSRLLPGSQTLSSPIMEIDAIIHPSSSSESGDAVILDDQSSVKSKPSPTGSERSNRPELEPRTPCRWRGYGSPEVSNFPEMALSSTPSVVAPSSEPENDRADDEAKIETESVATTISGVIENFPTQNHNAIDRIDNPRVAENRPAVSESHDSDETHYADGSPVRHSVAEVTPMKKRLSANDRTMSRNRSDLISEASSSSKNNENTGMYVPAGRTPRDIGRRRKRAKKGSLVARLQSLVSLRVSSLQIWQYRASRNEFKNPRHQFVKLGIKERETRYGRHFLMANVLEDAHNLLGDLFCRANDDVPKASERGSVSLIIVPEVNGTPKIGLNSVLDVYPPWEVMDHASRLLCVLYFDIVTTQTSPPSDVVTEDDVVVEERVLEEFQCPCFHRGAIDPSCAVKFTNTRPSFIGEIFGSSNRT